MAEDVLDKCFAAKLLPAKPSVTAQLMLVGAHIKGRIGGQKISDAPGLHLYGSEAGTVQAMAEDEALGGGLTVAMVRFAAKYEYALTVEDVLARRSRLLFLDAALAKSMATEVAKLLQKVTGIDPQLDAFFSLCDQYLHVPP